MQRYCEFCGSAVSEHAAFCSKCGGKLAIAETAQPRVSVLSKTITETVLLDEQGIKVTNARFLVDGQTYAMAGITSVKTDVEYPPKGGPYVVIGVGVVLLFTALSGGSFGGLITGGGVLAGGIAWLRSRKPEYLVLLMTASGEEKPYESTDGVFVGKIVTAINDAMVHRG